MKKSILSIFILSVALCMLIAGCSRPQPTDSGVFTKATYDTTSKSKAELETRATISIIQVQTYVKDNPKAERAYGGCYVGDDKMAHVLLTKKATSKIIDEINYNTQNAVTIELCKYTLVELKDLRDSIKDSLPEDIKSNVESVSVKEQTNKVLIQMNDCSEKKIEQFKDLVSDSDAIEFEEVK